MKSFNSDLKALFKNYVDNKAGSKFKNKEEEKLLKREKLFDFNNDGVVDKKDLIEALTNGLDINSDGKISEDEKTFLAAYAAEITSAAISDTSNQTGTKESTMTDKPAEAAKADSAEQKADKAELKTDTTDANAPKPIDYYKLPNGVKIPLYEGDRVRKMSNCILVENRSTQKAYSKEGELLFTQNGRTASFKNISVQYIKNKVVLKKKGTMVEIEKGSTVNMSGKNIGVTSPDGKISKEYSSYDLSLQFTNTINEKNDEKIVERKGENTITKVSSGTITVKGSSEEGPEVDDSGNVAFKNGKHIGVRANSIIEIKDNGSVVIKTIKQGVAAEITAYDKDGNKIQNPEELDADYLYKIFNARKKYNEFMKLDIKTRKEIKDITPWKEADINGDGVIDTKDSKFISAYSPTALKKLSMNGAKMPLPDLNKDGVIDSKDLMAAFNGIDITGDGKISDEEKEFLTFFNERWGKTYFENNKNNLSTDDLVAFRNIKSETGIELANGWYFDKLIAKANIVAEKDKITFEGGKEVEISAESKTNTDSLTKRTIVSSDDIKITQENGIGKGNTYLEISNGASVQEYDLTGNVLYNLKNNSPKNYKIHRGTSVAYADWSKLILPNGRNIKLEIGDSVVINPDGTVNVTSKDGKTVKKYSAIGTLLSTEKA